MMRRTFTRMMAAGVLVAGLGLGVAAQQKPTAPGAAAQPKVTVYKSPT